MRYPLIRYVLVPIFAFWLCFGASVTADENATFEVPGYYETVQAVVDASDPGNELECSILRVPRDYETIQAAVDAADPGDFIKVGPGEYAGATITKPVVLRGSGERTRIVSGVWFQAGDPSDPLDTSFFIEPEAGGTVITNFVLVTGNFPHVFGIFARDADNITLSRLKILNPWQGITNNGGNNWKIIHNKIEGYPPDSTYATGIYLPADISDLKNNFVAFNKIDFSDGSGDEANGIFVITFEDIWVGESTGNVIVFNQTKANETSFAFASFGISLIFADYTFGASNHTFVDNVVSFNDCRENNIPVDLFCWPEDPNCAQTFHERNKIVGNLGDTESREGDAVINGKSRILDLHFD